MTPERRKHHTHSLSVIDRKTEGARKLVLMRCVCRVEQWVREDSKVIQLRKCDCPPKPYLHKTKVCNGCQKRKLVEEFFYDSRDGKPRSQCKKCISTDNAKRAPRYRKQIRAYMRGHHIHRKFGISEEKYDALLKDSGDKCAICKEPEKHKHRKALSLDHCHQSGRLRGFICSRCNLVLGAVKDMPELLDNLATYLRKHV